MAGLFIALFVDKCTACQSHWKSDFGWHRFQKWAYSLALAWSVRGLKSLKRFWNTWWPSEAASRLVSLSNYCLWCVFFFSVSWSRAYSLCGLRLYTSCTSNDITYNSIRFKKPLDSFSPQIQRKGSGDYLIMILAVNRRLWAIFLSRVHLEQEQTPGSRLKTYISLCLSDSWFSETLYSQYVSSWMKIIVSVHVSPNYIYLIDC